MALNEENNKIENLQQTPYFYSFLTEILKPLFLDKQYAEWERFANELFISHFALPNMAEPLVNPLAVSDDGGDLRVRRRASQRAEQAPEVEQALEVEQVNEIVNLNNLSNIDKHTKDLISLSYISLEREIASRVKYEIAILEKKEPQLVFHSSEKERKFKKFWKAHKQSSLTERDIYYIDFITDAIFYEIDRIKKAIVKLRQDANPLIEINKEHIIKNTPVELRDAKIAEIEKALRPNEASLKVLNTHIDNLIASIQRIEACVQEPEFVRRLLISKDNSYKTLETLNKELRKVLYPKMEKLFHKYNKEFQLKQFIQLGWNNLAEERWPTTANMEADEKIEFVAMKQILIRCSQLETGLNEDNLLCEPAITGTAATMQLLDFLKTELTVTFQEQINLAESQVEEAPQNPVVGEPVHAEEDNIDPDLHLEQQEEPLNEVAQLRQAENPALKRFSRLGASLSQLAEKTISKIEKYLPGPEEQLIVIKTMVFNYQMNSTKRRNSFLAMPSFLRWLTGYNEEKANTKLQLAGEIESLLAESSEQKDAMDMRALILEISSKLEEIKKEDYKNSFRRRFHMPGTLYNEVRKALDKVNFYLKQEDNYKDIQFSPAKSRHPTENRVRNFEPYAPLQPHEKIRRGAAPLEKTRSAVTARKARVKDTINDILRSVDKEGGFITPERQDKAEDNFKAARTRSLIY